MSKERQGTHLGEASPDVHAQERPCEVVVLEGRQGRQAKIKPERE